ncbi:hypothetical protein [Streptomyces sp. UG1]|uniref:hypothetical protein n=1 Tax=Streptomyces sp. UG1 TaxID=3417652 RepID=UPI003CF51925
MTKVTPYPETPAAVAAAALDAIEARPDAFNMLNWAWLPGVTSLAPDETPACGTTLCAAGWAAHVTGWTIVHLQHEHYVDITVREGDGTESSTLGDLFAQKGDKRRLIGQVAEEALGLKPGETFWYHDAPTALARLREIAGR